MKKGNVIEVGKLELRGQSGKYYPFGVFEYAYGWPEAPGIYFISEGIIGADGSTGHNILGGGEAENLKSEIADIADRIRFSKYGSPYLLWLEEKSVITRIAILQDLKDYFNPRRSR